jgi:hypothetical protein
MRLGGAQHNGWLPIGAAEPLPTPVVQVVVDLEIVGDANGAMLYWYGSDGSRWNYSRESVQGAIEQADYSWGVDREEWSPGSLEPQD